MPAAMGVSARIGLVEVARPSDAGGPHDRRSEPVTHAEDDRSIQRAHTRSQLPAAPGAVPRDPWGPQVFHVKRASRGGVGMRSACRLRPPCVDPNQPVPPTGLGPRHRPNRSSHRAEARRPPQGRQQIIDWKSRRQNSDEPCMNGRCKAPLQRRTEHVTAPARLAVGSVLTASTSCRSQTTPLRGSHDGRGHCVADRVPGAVHVSWRLGPSPEGSPFVARPTSTRSALVLAWATRPTSSTRDVPPSAPRVRRPRRRRSRSPPRRRVQLEFGVNSDERLGGFT